MGFIRDLISNIGYARIGLALDVRDPFKKRFIEGEMKKRGIKYKQGYFSSDNSTVYAVIGGKREVIQEFVDGLIKSMDNPEYYVTKHKIFRTKIQALIIK